MNESLVPSLRPAGLPPYLGVYADLAELVRLKFRIRGFSFLPRQPVHSILAGRYASRLRGRGMNFEEIRRYLPGDDIRNMDWHVTARASRTCACTPRSVTAPCCSLSISGRACFSVAAAP
jgi:uncharacterized protein (DUF58 family)